MEKIYASVIWKTWDDREEKHVWVPTIMGIEQIEEIRGKMKSGEYKNPVKIMFEGGTFLACAEYNEKTFMYDDEKRKWSW